MSTNLTQPSSQSPSKATSRVFRGESRAKPEPPLLSIPCSIAIIGSIVPAFSRLMRSLGHVDGTLWSPIMTWWRWRIFWLVFSMFLGMKVNKQGLAKWTHLLMSIAKGCTVREVPMIRSRSQLGKSVCISWKNLVGRFSRKNTISGLTRPLHSLHVGMLSLKISSAIQYRSLQCWIKAEKIDITKRMKDADLTKTLRIIKEFPLIAN